MGGKQRPFLWFCLVLLSACSRPVDQKPQVTVEPVTVEERPATRTVPATLEPFQKLEIHYPIDIKIEKVLVNLGDAVELGDTLFTISEQDFQLGLSQLRNDLMEQEAQLEKNLYFLQHRDRLLDEGKIDQTMFDTLEAEVKTLQADVQKLKNLLLLAENQIRSANVIAPFAGVISAKQAATGALIYAGDPVMTLSQTDPMYLSFYLPTKDAQIISKGMNVAVRIDALGKKPFSAPITFISPELDPKQRAFNLKATLANENHLLKGGMNAEVSFVSPTMTKVLSIPAKALLTEGDKDYVYVVRENKAWRVRVFTRKNADQPDSVEILEGLFENDSVVTQGYQNLKTGSEVNLWR